MNDFVLSCCSTADLTAEHFAARDIHYICFHYSLNGKQYADDLGKSMPFDQFYQAMADGAETQTSQVNVEEFTAYFTPFLEQGKDILHVTLSSGISGVYNSACVAREELLQKYPDRKIYIVDSLGASSGYGLLMDRLADLRDKGEDVDSVYEWALPNRLRPCRAQHHQRKVLLGRGLHQLAAHPQVEHVHPLQLPVLRNGAAVPPHIEVSADERIHGLNELFVRGHMPLLQHLFQAFRLFRRVATRERFPKRAELALHIQELPFDGLRLGIAHLCAHKLDAQPLEDGRPVPADGPLGRFGYYARSCGNRSSQYSRSAASKVLRTRIS